MDGLNDCVSQVVDSQWLDNGYKWMIDNQQQHIVNHDYVFDNHEQWLVRHEEMLTKHENVFREMQTQSYCLMEIIKSHDKLHKEDVARLESKIDYLTNELGDCQMDLQSQSEENDNLSEKGDILEENDNSDTSELTDTIEENDNSDTSSNFYAPIASLTKSSIISVTFNNKVLTRDLRKWAPLHRKLCESVIEKHNINYLIKTSKMKIVNGECSDRRFVYTKTMGISIQGASANQTFKDIKNLTKKTNISLELIIRFQNDVEQHFKFGQE